MTPCLFCGARFNGRINRLYCTALCKKRAENAQNRLKRLVSQYRQSEATEQQARAGNDFDTARRAIAKRGRLLVEIQQTTRQRIFWESEAWQTTFHLILEELKNRPINRPKVLP